MNQLIVAKCDEQRAEGQRTSVQQGEYTVTATGRFCEERAVGTLLRYSQSASRNSADNTSTYSIDSDRTPTQGNPQTIRMPQR